MELLSGTLRCLDPDPCDDRVEGSRFRVSDLVLNPSTGTSGHIQSISHAPHKAVALDFWYSSSLWIAHVMCVFGALTGADWCCLALPAGGLWVEARLHLPRQHARAPPVLERKGSQEERRSGHEDANVRPRLLSSDAGPTARLEDVDNTVFGSKFIPAYITR